MCLAGSWRFYDERCRFTAERLNVQALYAACSGMLEPEPRDHWSSIFRTQRSRVLFAMLTAILTLLLLVLSLSDQKDKDFYTFKVVNIRGKLVSLEKYRGSVSLVVNVASECGYTEDHYKGLQQLQRELGSYHFNVLAFPCNQFGQQEPGSNKEIESFARKQFSATFPMFSKTAVTGTGANVAFQYLIDSTKQEPNWNFWKYLVGADGKVVNAWGPSVSVEEIRPQIAALVRELIIKRKDEL